MQIFKTKEKGLSKRVKNINKTTHGRVQKKQGLCLFWGEIEVKKTQAIKRHKVKGRVVPFGGKKGTSLVRKGISWIKKGTSRIRITWGTLPTLPLLPEQIWESDIATKRHGKNTKVQKHR